jgi:asparagine synthase (glutamine-hydrolysing)
LIIIKGIKDFSQKSKYGFICMTQEIMMSAICGIFNRTGGPVEPEILNRMMETLNHRGLDGRSKWLKGQIGLGQQMVRIVPESVDEVLPFYDQTGGLALVADARLDNRETLLEQLAIPKAEWPKLPDSQLILKAYQQWGLECASRLLGDFAFVIWDERRRELVCVTDPLGMNSFYYYLTPELFVFASEIKAIHAMPGIERRINLKKLALQTIPASRFLDGEEETTFFEGVSQLAATTVMTISAERVTRHHYWDPDIGRQIRYKTESEYAEAFQELFLQAVAARMRSVEPVVALYSGGLDSSGITAAAAKLMKAKQGRKLTALAAVLPPGYQGSGTDERYYIDLMQGRDDLTIEYICDPERGPFDRLAELIRGGESPAYTSRHYLYSTFADAAERQGARVILDGCFGEMGPSFHGDGYYAELFRQGHWWRLLYESFRRSQREQRNWLGLIKSEVLKPLLPQSWQAKYFTLFDIAQIQASLPVNPEFIRGQLGAEWERYRQSTGSIGTIAPDHRVNQFRSIQLSRRPRSGNGFVGYEKVQFRFPYRDRRLVEFCLAAPGELKMRNGYKRYLIRAGTQGLMPDELRFRTSKEPFSPDFHDRYNHQKEIARQILRETPRTGLTAEIVDLPKLERMLDYEMQTNRCNTPAEFAAMHAVPRGIYLIAFLRMFE